MRDVYFKILQRQNRFRNTKHLTTIPQDFCFNQSEFDLASRYLEGLSARQIKYCYPGHEDYPLAFYKIKEPPLFIEYRGEAWWKTTSFLSIVGSRDISPLTEALLKRMLPHVLLDLNIGVVSGGAIGVDQLAHHICLKQDKPTIFVLPSGLEALYPQSLNHFFSQDYIGKCCFLTEFESDQKIHKSFFFHRNRLIAALGEMTLVAQASLKSGSLLTVHHSLECGKPVLTFPCHPEVLGFEGNLQLIREGAYVVTQKSDLLDFWMAENWSSLR